MDLAGLEEIKGFLAQNAEAPAWVLVHKESGGFRTSFGVPVVWLEEKDAVVHAAIVGMLLKGSSGYEVQEYPALRGLLIRLVENNHGGEFIWKSGRVRLSAADVLQLAVRITATGGGEEGG